MSNKKQCLNDDQTHQGSIVSFWAMVSEVGKKYSGTSANVSNMAPFALNASETGSGLRHLRSEVRGSQAAILGGRQILGLAVDNGCAIVSAGSWHFNEAGGVESVQ